MPTPTTRPVSYTHLDTPEPIFPDTVILEVDGHQGGLPVVAVDDVGPEFEVPQHPHHGPGEEAEALSVIHIAVELRAAEVLLVVQEVPCHALPLQGEETAVAVPPGQVHIVVALELQLVTEALLHPRIQRQHHGDLRACLLYTSSLFAGAGTSAGAGSSAGAAASAFSGTGAGSS